MDNGHKYMSRNHGSTVESSCKMKNMEHAFHELNRHYIKMKKKEMKENTDLVFSFLSQLVNIMRMCDKLFDSMNPSLDYLGSYFDRLRVGQPTEYDINIILAIPVKHGTIKLDACNSCDGYTNLIMPSEFRRLSKIPATASKGFIKTRSWCNKNYCLSVVKFRTWMQSVVDNALNTLPSQDGKRIIKIKNKHYKISAKQSGPANTLLLSRGKTSIDIDLVPTFTFELPIISTGSQVLFSKVESTKIPRYFVVPKPNGDDFSWRLAFPFQERHLLKDTYNLKSAIRLIKHFRDVQGFTKLSSYYIKTLFLWECSKNNNIYWKKNSLTYLVLNMLKILRECLQAKNIPNFWCPSHNLLGQIKAETCQNWANRISFILNKIEHVGLKHNVIQEYFIKSNKLINML